MPFAASSYAVEVNARAAALESITTPDVKGHVDALADDTFEGREAGTRGNRAAGIYIIDRLTKLGLAPAGTKGGFYQNGGGASNILAQFEGSDPELKNEVILVGAHYDHVGYGTYRNSYGPVGYIHNGADDNASGVAALLELAEALSKLPQKPKRTILFAFWDGEEKGLWGSKYWVDHPTVPLDRVRLAVNIDMIGRMRGARLEVFGIRTLPGLRRTISRQNTESLALEFDWDVRGDSDHYSFFSRNVPFLMLHTGRHPDYHRPSDDAERINGDGLRQITQLLFGVVVDLADAAELPKFRERSRMESQGDRRASEVALRPPRGRLGISWDEKQAADGKIVVDRVSSGSPAAAAGLVRGDQIVTFSGREVRDAEQFRQLVLSAANPVPITVARGGQEAPLEMTLQLEGEPVRLGIAWRTDETEPASVIINRLTPGSPADAAGLRSGDRIYKINGREFATGDEFRELATTLPFPLVMEVDTAGRVRMVEVPGFDSSDEATSSEPPAPDADKKDS
jgi:hypothetical protein